MTIESQSSIPTTDTQVQQQRAEISAPAPIASAVPAVAWRSEEGAAPSDISVVTPTDASAFMMTVVQSPDSMVQSSVCAPVPATDATQNVSSP